MPKIIITGGTGLVGKVLTRALLRKGYSVCILSRNANRGSGEQGLTYAYWDPAAGKIDNSALSDADHIIHLAGAGVADKRWTAQRKREIRDSRVQSGELLVKALSEVPNNVRSVISASAIGWYGPDPRPGFEGFVESDPPHDDFLGNTCREWEAATIPAREIGKRLVHLRIGIVLSKNGGALPEFKRPLQFGVAAVLGSGSQMISWIHIDDLVQLFLRAVEDESMSGAYNAVAPNPVSNKEMMMTIARCKKRFFILVKVPAFLLKLILGEMSIEVLKSTTVRPARLLEIGHQFQYGRVGEAVCSQ